ncbi:hypothetical protein KBC70_01125 [Candidatus Woesebacteria bacterium]|nr:hypothetical protein [Candidatus Woesebacteria bacterium]
MRSSQESTPLRIHPHIYWISGLLVLLGILIFVVPPSSLIIVLIAAVLVMLLHYFIVSIYFSEKTAFFSAFLVWGGVFLYLISALNGLNVMMYSALIVALGIYLYR